MPDLLRSAFEALGTEMDDYLRLKPVDPMYRATYHDGTELRVWHGRDRMTREIREVVGPEAARQFGRFADWLRELYLLERDHFLHANFDPPLSPEQPRVGKHGVRTGKTRGY